MSDLHRGSRFLRLLRSICAKTACARRAIVALFVAVATILATFMIMPSASMGASQQGEPSQVQTQVQTQEQTQSEKTENNTAETAGAPAKNGSAANGENSESKAEEPKTVDPKNSQTSAKQDASGSGAAQNVDSEKKQGAAKEDANKNPNKDAKKDAAERAKKEESAKKSNRQKRSAKEENRAANGGVELPEECKKAGKGIKFFKDCYVLFYNSSKGSLTLDAQLDGKAENISPEFQRYKDKKNKILESTTTPSNTIFKLVKVKDDKSQYMPIPDWVKFKNPDSNDSTSSSDGVITIHPVGKWTECTQYRFGIQVQYPDYSDKNRKTHSSIFKINVNVKKDVGNNDLTLNVYNHEDSSTRSEINGKDGITFESGEDGKYSPITPIFIDSKSTKKPGLIYHHMICHKESSSDGSDDSNDNYTVDKVNGLSLGVKNGASGTQTQFAHIENQTKPSTGADAYAVYEKGDDTTERSQSWISGKPEAAGTFTCKVFAVKNVGISYSKNTGKTFSTEYFAEYVTNRINGNTSEVFKNPDTNIYEAHIPGTNGLDESVYKPQKTIDWDYKTIKIVFKSNNVVGENDLKLNVYPFKNGDGSLPAALSDKNNNISAMLGMELKPFVDATSKADSKKTITLKMLCAKGEEKWSSNPDGLGLSGVPEDKDQTRCKKGDADCTAAAQTTMDVSIKPTKVGDYQCVVYALKDAALAAFKGVTTNVTPKAISNVFDSANLKASIDYAQLAINIHVPKKFELPDTGGQNWNLQLGAVAAVMVSVLAAGFVISQSEACRKLLYERRRC